MKLLVFISCLLVELMSVYIFINFAANSISDLWQYCAIAIIVSLTTQAVVIKNE